MQVCNNNYCVLRTRMRMRNNSAIRLVHRISVTGVIARTRTPDQIDLFVESRRYFLTESQRSCF